MTLSSVDLRLRGFHRRGGEVRIRCGVVRFLLADCLAFRERPQPRELPVGLRLLRLGTRDVGVGGRDLRLVLAGIDDEQRLPGLDGGAFLEQPLFEDAGHAGAHLDVLRALRLSHVLESHRKRMRLHGLDGHFRRREAVKSTRLLLGLPARSHQRDESEWQQAGK